MDSILKAVGCAIRQVRVDRQMSQEALAELSGLDRTYISTVEANKRNVTLQNLKKIAEGLSVSLTELIQLAEDRLEQ